MKTLQFYSTAFVSSPGATVRGAVNWLVLSMRRGILNGFSLAELRLSRSSDLTGGGDAAAETVSSLSASAFVAFFRFFPRGGALDSSLEAEAVEFSLPSRT